MLFYKIKAISIKSKKEMKIIKAIFLLAIAAVVASCSKDDIDSLLKNHQSIPLEINTDFNTYQSPDGDNFYRNAFSDKNDMHVYKLSLEAGKKYHVFCIQKNLLITNMEMYLLNSEMDTISKSQMLNNIPEIFFTANKTTDYYLITKLNGDFNQQLSYNIYFESCAPVNYSFFGKNWSGTGKWTGLNETAISFKGHDTGMMRWLKLDSDLPEFPEIVFTLKSDTKTSMPSIGFVFNASENMMNWGDFQEKLPQSGVCFNIQTNSTYRKITFENGGMGFQYGEIDIPNLDLQSGVNVKIIYDYPFNRLVYINNTPVGYVSNVKNHKFFLIIEDFGHDEIRIENLQMKNSKE